MKAKEKSRVSKRGAADVDSSLTKPVAGVYAIYLVGTPFAYVGQSTNIAHRWVQHRDAWVWPNAARYEILQRVRERGDALTRAEARAHDALRRDGYLLLSSVAEVSLNGRNGGSLTDGHERFLRAIRRGQARAAAEHGVHP